MLRYDAKKTWAIYPIPGGDDIYLRSCSDKWWSDAYSVGTELLFFTDLYLCGIEFSLAFGTFYLFIFSEFRVDWKGDCFEVANLPIISLQ